MTTKKGDFIQVNYTAKIKESGKVFDTTDNALAQKENLHQHNQGPITICIGEHQVIEGFEKALEGKEVKKEYTVSIEPGKAFGRKSAKLVQLIPTSKLREQKVTPQRGMQIIVDDNIGVIRVVSGGRVMVDFNHPLAGKEITYTFTIERVLEDNKEKLKSILKIALGKEPNIELEGQKATVKDEIPSQHQKFLKKKIPTLIPAINELEFKK